MKKSELYHLAQIAVINSPNLAPETKLEIMKVLIPDESSARYWEEQEARKMENGGKNNGESV